MNAIPVTDLPPQPTVFTLSGVVENVFAVPVASSVGTLELDNALAIVRLAGREPRVDMVASDYLDNASAGSIRYCGPVDERRVAYTQTRRLVLVDIAAGVAECHPVCRGLSEYAESFRVVDGPGCCFAVEVQRFGAAKAPRRIVRTVRIGDGGAQTLGELDTGPYPRGYTPPLVCAGRTVLVGEGGGRRLRAYDLSLRPVAHPLPHLLEERDTLRLVTEVAVHPSLPVAAIIDRDPARNEGYAVHLARWDCDEPGVAPVPVAGVEPGALYCSHVEFSPDGSWMVFRDETNDQYNPGFVALPVVAGERVALGTPLRFRPCIAADLTSTCWTTGPLGFVACDGAGVYVWNL